MASDSDVVMPGASPPVGSLSARGLERVLHLCFFLLGMGLMAPITAILQTMDYLNIYFAEYYPSRTLYTGYNTANLLALVVLFKFGERLWPNKRGRLLTGYSLYTVILVALPLIDFIIMDHNTGLPAKAGLRLAFTVWAVGSCVAGLADAMISTVAYSQAAAIGQRFTHAFVGGRATSGLVMAALRCVSKGALKQNLSGLKQSTFIYVLIAAMIVFTAFLIAAVVLPRLAPQIEQFKERRGVRAGAKVQIRTHEKCTFCRLQDMQPPLASLEAEGMKPNPSLPIPPVGPPDAGITTWGSGMPLLPGASPQQQQQPGHGSRAGRPQHGSAWGGSRLATANSMDLQEHQRRSGLRQVLDAALPVAAVAGAADVIAEEGEDSQPPSPPAPAPEGSCHSCSSSHSSSPRATTDANVTVVTDVVPGGGGAPKQEQQPELIRAAPGAAGGLDQHMVVYLQGYVDAAQHVASELHGGSAPHQHCTCGKDVLDSKDVVSLPDSSLDSDNASSSNGSSLDSSRYDDSWAALFKVVWPFCLAVQPAPMTTATILPLNLSSQIANWPVVTASRWHVQIMMVTVQLGFFLGSAILPIRTPRRPRVSLPLLACLIFIFGPIFAAALMCNAAPYVFLALALCMHTYSGYMTSTVFCVASQGFANKEVIRVQQLLVLSMGVSYVVGSCISWIWVFIGKA